MGTIKELWYGNIHPQEQLRQNSEERKKLVEYIIRHKTELLASMNAEQKEIFEKYIDCQTEYAMLFELSNFELGFQLGARFMLEVLIDKEADTP